MQGGKAVLKFFRVSADSSVQHPDSEEEDKESDVEETKGKGKGKKKRDKPGFRDRKASAVVRPTPNFLSVVQSFSS